MITSKNEDGYYQGCPQCGNINLSEFRLYGKGYVRVSVDWTGEVTEVGSGGWPSDWDIEEISCTCEIDIDGIQEPEADTITCLATDCDAELQHLHTLDEDWAYDHDRDWEEFMEECAVHENPAEGSGGGKVKETAYNLELEAADNALRITDSCFVSYGGLGVTEPVHKDSLYRLAKVGIALGVAGYNEQEDGEGNRPIRVRRWRIDSCLTDHEGKVDDTLDQYMGGFLRLDFGGRIFMIWVPRRLSTLSEEVKKDLNDVVYIIEGSQYTPSDWDGNRETEQTIAANLIGTTRDMLARTLAVVFNVEPHSLEKKEEVAA